MKKKNRPIGCYPSRYLTKFLGALNFSIRWWEPPFEKTDPRRNETTKTYFTGHWLERGGKLSCKVSRYHRRAGHKGSPGRVSGWLVGIEKNSRRLPGWQVIKAGTSTVPGRPLAPGADDHFSVWPGFRFTAPTCLVSNGRPAADCFGASKFVEKCQYRERSIRIGRSKIQWGASYFDLLRIFHRDISRVIRDIHERARAEEDLNWKVVPRLRSEIRVISSRVFKAHFSE